MAFRSDYEAKKTWDPDSGWELFATHGPDFERFQLKRPTSPSIEFWGRTESLEKTGEHNATGAPIYNKVFKVRAVNGVAWPVSEQHKQVIHDALNAYGALHNGPQGRVDVVYSEPSWSTYLIVLLDCGDSFSRRPPAGKPPGIF